MAYIVNQELEKSDNEDVKKQLSIFNEHKELDAEDFGHRFDGIQHEFEYPCRLR
jgi:hypothetical protein